MQDLNDLYLFARIVDHRGFTAASRALGIPKSRLSRRVAALEDRLGVRLIQRSTRRFAVTEIGRQYHQRCQAMLAEAEAAQAVIDHVQGEPSGLIRITAPAKIAETVLGPLLPRFLAEHPQVEIVLRVTGRPVDLIEEGIDLALRVRSAPHEDSDLVIRSLGRARVVLVASPHLLARHGTPASPEELARLPGLDMERSDGRHLWRLDDPASGAATPVAFRPRLVTDEMLVLKQAAIAGTGVVMLPYSFCRDEIDAGDLATVLPAWRLPEGELQAVFASRRGLVPAVRKLIDYLAIEVPRLAQCREEVGERAVLERLRPAALTAAPPA
jgi:DNA-binding transcriptional LysR family regulator